MGTVAAKEPVVALLGDGRESARSNWDLAAPFDLDLLEGELDDSGGGADSVDTHAAGGAGPGVAVTERCGRRPTRAETERRG